MKELIILGKGATREDCPFDAEVWGVNDVYSDPGVKGKRIDKLFAFDPMPNINFIEGMRQAAPIVSWQDYADIKYPLDEIIREFHSKYFTSTICYMIALAIYWGYERIKLYGVDYLIGYEYIEAKGGVEYWLGRAEERGIQVKISEGSQLLQTFNGQIYGKIDDNFIVLYLWERFALLGLLHSPRDLDMAKANMELKGRLGFTDKEIKEFGIIARVVGKGKMSFQCKDEKARNFYLTERACNLLRDALIKAEQSSSMPDPYLTLYEKFVTARTPEMERRETNEAGMGNRR